MQLTISRNLLLQAINLIFKAADKRHSMAILANVKIVLTETQLVLTASDLEVELQATLNLPKGACQIAGQTTVSAIKLKDIIKLLPEDQPIIIQTVKDNQCLINSGNSRFKLSTLPAQDFPLLGEPEQVTPIQIGREMLTDLLDKTHFAMAIQDVRYYLTGMLFEVKDNIFATVATDGHRLAIARGEIVANDMTLSAILPRKAVLELQRLIGELKRLMPNHDNEITLNVGREFVQVILPFGEMNSEGNIENPIIVSFTARLIDGKFPDYRRVMPKEGNNIAHIEREPLINVLRRVAVLISEKKSKGVVFDFSSETVLEIKANNSEQDEAREQILVRYQGEPLEISFNVVYLLDVLNAIQGDVVFYMGEANASVLVKQADTSQHEFIVMPMRI